MRIKVRLFARYREAVGRSEIEIEVGDGATVASLVDRLEQELVGLSFSNLAVAVNKEQVEPQFMLNHGDEVAFLPPMSGG